MSRHLTWSNFETDIIRAGEERLHRICSSPKAAIFSDRGGLRIGLVIESGEGELPVELTRLLRLEVNHIFSDGVACLQVACPERQLFREAYLLFTTVIDRVIDNGESSSVALHHELVALGALGEEKGNLSLEKQIGLFGELFVLRDLLGRYGPDAVNAWTGPIREPHDFRAGKFELEVKTTLGRKRKHRIHGLDQTVPTPGHSLAFVSLTIGPAGAGGGESLPSVIACIRGMLRQSGKFINAFEEALAASGYADCDSAIYFREWVPRELPTIIPVDGEFPSLTTELLARSLGRLMARIEQVDYDVNLDGLGRNWSPDDTAMPKSLNE